MKKYLVIVLFICSCSVSSESRVRPMDWAAPIIGTSLENLHKVDKGVYRSEQPSKKGFAELSAMGIQESLNLREYHSDNDEAKDTDIRLHRIKIATGSITEDQIIQALTFIKNRKGPILVHCWHGSDRTGAVIASYRVVFNNWPKQKAIDELRHGGFGYHATIYPNIVELVQNLDVKKIKTKIGMK